MYVCQIDTRGAEKLIERSMDIVKGRREAGRRIKVRRKSVGVDRRGDRSVVRPGLWGDGRRRQGMEGGNNECQEREALDGGRRKVKREGESRSTSTGDADGGASCEGIHSGRV